MLRGRPEVMPDKRPLASGECILAIEMKFIEVSLSLDSKQLGHVAPACCTGRRLQLLACAPQVLLSQAQECAVMCEMLRNVTQLSTGSRFQTLSCHEGSSPFRH